MKCPYPDCPNNDLIKEKHAYCFECGRSLRGDNFKPTASPLPSSHAQEATDESDVCDEKPQPSPDETDGQRKRKGEGAEEKPAKRKSLGPGDGSDQSEPTDATATALQKLALEKTPKDQQLQEQAGPDAGTGQEESDQESSSDNTSCSKSHPTKATDECQPEGTIQGVQQKNVIQIDPLQHGTGNICESELPLQQPDSSNASNTPMDTEQVWFKRNDDKASCKSTKDLVRTESNQSGGDISSSKDDNDDSEGGSENESDSEEDDSNPQRDETGSRTKKTLLSKSQKKREKKKLKKQRKQEERRKAAQKKNQESNDNRAPQKGKTGNLRGKKPPVGQEKPSNNDNGGENGRENNAAKEETNSEYFAKHEGSKMTIVFHAVLAPHFKFEKDQGDRIFMRFGGVAFGKFNEDVVEVYPERPLDNDFIVIQASLLIPCTYLSGKIPYKYIVLKGKAKDSKDNYLWDELVGFGARTNRCLQVPKERCKPGAVWHQYDDAVFSSPTWFQNMRNKLPSMLKSMDPVEGRNIATREMLPAWEGFVVGEVDTQMTAQDAIDVIQNLSFCMTQTQVEEYGRFKRNVPGSYDFSRILKNFLKEKIDQNASLPSDGQDKNRASNHLVSSVAIAYVLYAHHVYLDGEEYGKLFSSLLLCGDPSEKTCAAFDMLLRHFDGGKWV